MALSYEDRRNTALDRLQQMATARAARNQMLMQKAENRYQQYMSEMRRREEEARKKAKGSWLGNTLKGVFSGGMTGLLATGNPFGALAGAGMGFGVGALGHATGSTDFLQQNIYPAAMMFGGLGAQQRMAGGGSLFNWGGGPTPGTTIYGPVTSMSGGSLLSPGETWMNGRIGTGY